MPNRPFLSAVGLAILIILADRESATGAKPAPELARHLTAIAALAKSSPKEIGRAHV